MEEAHANLLGTIEKEALAEKEKLERTYSEQIKKIHEEVEKEASRLREEGLKAADKQLQTERLRRIGKAEQELKKALLVARHKIIEDVLKAVEEEMEAIRNNKTLYPKIFREMFTTAIREFQGKAIVQVNKKDQALCEELLGESNRPYILGIPGAGNKMGGEVTPADGVWIEITEDITGGIVIKSEDGRLTINNTFESRILKTRERALETLGKVLFKG